MKLFRAIILTAFFCGATCFAQFDVGIVLPFENESRDPKLDWIGESFVEVLSSDLASPRFMMLDRRERTAAFDSLGIPNTSILSDATIYKIGQAVDATKLVQGRYEYANGVFKATARVMDMEGPTLSREFTESGPLADLMQLQSGLAWQIVQFLRPSLPVSKSEFINDHRGARLDAFENYLRGLIAKNRADQIRYFRTAARLDAQFPKPAFELGLIYFHDRDYPTSTLWLSKIRRVDEDYLEASYFLGLANLYLEQYERSIAAFRAVAQQLPLNEVYNNMGIALLREDKPGATQFFEKAIESNPSDPDYQFNLGYALWKRNNCAQAIPHLKKAMQPSVAAQWRVIYKQCLEKTGQNDEAARQQKILEQQSPEWSGNVAPQRLERLERAKDSYDAPSIRQLRMLAQVQTELKHLKLSQAEHVDVHFQQAQKLLAEGFDREAVEELEEAIDYDPTFVQGYIQLAGIDAKAGRFDDALKTLTQANQHKESAGAYLMMAKIYMEQGKLDDAMVQLNAALRVEPSSAQANLMMQQINSRGGR